MATANDCKKARSTTVPARFIPNTILGIIHGLGDPYVAKPGLGGMAAYPLGTMVAICIMLEAEQTAYHKMVGMLRNNHDIYHAFSLIKET